jgi:hypothetical protein
MNIAAFYTLGKRPPRWFDSPINQFRFTSLLRRHFNFLFFLFRGMLNHIQNEADGLLGESRDQIIVPSLLPVDPVEPEPALSQYEPAHRLIYPESRKSEAVEASRPRLLEIDEVLVRHGVVHQKPTRGHQCEDQ